MGFWDSYNSAYAASKSALDQQKQAATTAQISGALARGDYDAAARAAYSGGQIQAGTALDSIAQRQKLSAAVGAYDPNDPSTIKGVLAAGGASYIPALTPRRRWPPDMVAL